MWVSLHAEGWFGYACYTVGGRHICWITRASLATPYVVFYCDGYVKQRNEHWVYALAKADAVRMIGKWGNRTAALPAVQERPEAFVRPARTSDQAAQAAQLALTADISAKKLLALSSGSD